METVQERVRPICGAKTRAGTPCKKAPMANGRCHLHGGKSLGGLASPTFKHGRYSRYLPANLTGRYEAARQDPDLLALRDEIALVDTRLGGLVEKLGSGESGSLWRRLRGAHQGLLQAREAKDSAGIASALTEIGELIERGTDEYVNWEEILGLLDQRRRLVESERKRLVEMQQMITVERAMLLVSAVVNAVARHVPDRKQLNAIATDIRGLITGSNGLDAGGHGRAGGGRRGRAGATDAAGVDAAVSRHPG